LETYDFNKVTILGEKHRQQKSFDPDTFNPTPLENDETVRKSVSLAPLESVSFFILVLAN
jgi:hypothetical protein